MITYVTGVPGAGKTLWTISEVKKMLAAEPERPVFYWFLPATADVADSLGWKRLTEARDSHTCPPASIIVIDEAWSTWPQRKPGSKTPEDVEAFATHRHRGHDFFIITQRVSSVDHFIRGLIGRHIHLERVFGLERARLNEWQKLGDPADYHSKQEAMSREFSFPKENYDLYKSADLHTVKKKLPLVRLAGIALLGVGVAAAFVSAIFLIRPDSSTDTAAPTAAHNPPTAQEQLQPVKVQAQGLEWAQRFTERLLGHPHSAPFYDSQLSAATMPKIAGCMHVTWGDRDICKCNSQQGTVITSIPFSACLYYVANGWFDPTKPDSAETDRDDSSGAAVASDSAAARPPAAIPTL